MYGEWCGIWRVQVYADSPLVGRADQGVEVEGLLTVRPTEMFTAIQHLWKVKKYRPGLRHMLQQIIVNLLQHGMPHDTRTTERMNLWSTRPTIDNVDGEEGVEFSVRLEPEELVGCE